jgi:PAS fold
LWHGFDPQAGVPTWEERFQRIHPEDRAAWQTTIDRAIAEKSDYEMEFRILLPAGTVRHTHAVGHPVVNASGDLVQFVGISIDIPERKRAEALRDGESHILEMMVRDASLEEILENLVRVVFARRSYSILPGMLVSCRKRRSCSWGSTSAAATSRFRFFRESARSPSGAFGSA